MSSNGQAMAKKINLVFMGGFTYPRGMAGTKRIQNVINALGQYPDVAVRVILQRQSSRDNTLAGVHAGTSYETVMGDVLQARMFAALPILYYKTCATLKRAIRPHQKNMIYFYGPLFFDSVVPLKYAQRLGYKIIFDVVEDFGLARDVSSSYYHYLRCKLANRLSSRIKDLSAGVIVISSRLAEKYAEITQGKVPVHYMPVSVDMDYFPEKPGGIKPNFSLFYAGSFGLKDGLPVLLDAVDKLASKYKNVHLVLTGRGDVDVMEDFFARMEVSPYKDRIEFKGYLNEKNYYILLNDADVPCMTRVDFAFAHTGFPFKLGEFLATGKPVIASRVSDVDKFLQHGHTAMLVQPGSSAEICEAAEFLINNPDSAAAMGARGRDVAKTFFDYRQQGKALHTFLESV